MAEVKIHPRWIWLSVLACALMAVASAGGILLKSVYARETASWAAQGVAQDILNLAVAIPALLVSAWLLRRGSVRALLVWLGLLVYVIYSYLMYSFGVHFGTMFPVYVATLGVAFFTFFGSLLSVDRAGLAADFPPDMKIKPAAAYLMFSGVAFSALWLSDIVRALAAGMDPAGLAEAGLPVNFVHVEDLGFILPGMIVTGILLWKRKPAGHLFAVPLMVFSAVMGMGIFSMFAVMARRGLGTAGPMGIVMGVLVTVSLILIVQFLRGVRRA